MAPLQDFLTAIQGPCELKRYFSVGVTTPTYEGMCFAITRHLMKCMEYDIHEKYKSGQISKKKVNELIHSSYTDFKLLTFTNFTFAKTNDVVTYFKRSVQHNLEVQEPIIYACLCGIDEKYLARYDIITSAYRSLDDKFDNGRRRALRKHMASPEVMWAFYGLYAEYCNS